MLQAQKASLRGRVLDSTDFSSLPGVHIAVGAPSQHLTTDDAGRFLIDGLEPGRYELQVSHIGYATETRLVEIGPAAITEVEVALARSHINLSSVVVSGNSRLAQQQISAIDIRLRPVNSSQEILRMVPGLFIAQHTGGGKAEQIFLRGYDIDHGTDINITVDGMPINMVSHAHGQGYSDLHFMTPELVEKVLYEKGSYNAGVGNMATAGSVAFETPEWLQSGMAKVEAGMFGLGRTVLAAPLYKQWKGRAKKQLYVAGEYVRNDGFFESPQQFQRFNGMLKYSNLKQDGSRFSASISAFGSNWYASGQIPQRAVDQGLITRYGAIDDTEGGNTNRYNLNLQYEKPLRQQWLMKHQAYLTRYHFNLYSNFTFFLDDEVNGDGIQQKENRTIAGYTGRFQNRHAYGRLPVQTTLGYGIRHDRITDLELNNQQQRRFLSHLQRGNVNETNASAWLSQQVWLSNRWSITGGLRFDQFWFDYENQIEPQSGGQNTKGVFSPKLQLSYKAAPQLQLNWNSGIGFHSNDTRVVIDKTADKILPRVFSSEVEANWKPLPGLMLQSALWTIYSEQEFVYVGDAGIVEPSGESHRYGLELLARYQLKNWLFADVNLNLTRARAIGVPKSEAYIPLAPALTSSGGITAKDKNGFSAGIRYRLLADRPANEDNSLTAEGYLLMDANLQYQFRKITLSLAIENIWNAEWNEAQFETTSRLRNEPEGVTEIHFTPGTPRFLKVGVSLRF